jgi:pSer/pThr/pTyr-binding forkhead associated (FHA) protein
MENASQQAFLSFEEGALAGQRFAIDKTSIIIGRGGPDTRCDIVLPERQVSREHAEVYLRRGHYFVRDLGSKNGTYLNGQPVTDAVELYDNDTIQIAFDSLGPMQLSLWRRSNPCLASALIPSQDVYG